jgi:hypothetical protein
LVEIIDNVEVDRGSGERVLRCREGVMKQLIRFRKEVEKKEGDEPVC